MQLGSSDVGASASVGEPRHAPHHLSVVGNHGEREVGRVGQERVEELLGAYWRPLVAYAERLLEEREAAEDVVQRAFVRIWENGHEVPPGDGELPFLYRVVRNLAANEWRRRETRDRCLHQGYHEGRPVLAAHASGPEEEMEARELAVALAAAVGNLPARRREVFILSRYHGLSNPQVAEVLGVSSQTVANQLVSALRTLRTTLSPYLDDTAPVLRVVRRGDLAAG